ncbi:MAG: transposase, partial [Selenomonadaceae bacterium]|nr:transposase [Selenomonadaceae bacterium]
RKGVKRQIVTDEIGCLLAVTIHKANLHDTKMGYWVTGLATFTYPTLKKICADGSYRGSFVFEAYKYFGLRVEISKKLKPHSWQVLPKSWRVERTFAWLNNLRRLSKDYELTAASAETLIKISHIHTLLKRL